MKRKRAHDEKAILKHKKKDQPLPNIDDENDSDDQTKTLEVRIDDVWLIFLKNYFDRLII